MSQITDKIRSKGYWDVAIRPEPFVADRADYADLDDILTKATVRLRGWPVPYIDYREPILRGDDWIGQDINAEIVSHYEAWRFFTSGQFNHLRAVSADWRQGAEATKAPEGFKAVIEVWEILFYLTEVFELAARLALSAAGDDHMTVDVHLHGLAGRGLVVGQPGRMPFLQPYEAHVPSLNRQVTVSREQLASDARHHAVEMARDFFLRFGWKPPTEQLEDHQQELARA